MAYKYNPLLKYNLQKVIQQGGGEDTQKKVSKFFASIDELEVGEIGEYQGETSETFTRGFFYERKDAVTITELGTTTDYVFSNYLDAYINNGLYHQQYFISSNYGLSVTQYMTQSCYIGDNLITVIMFSTDFLKSNFAESYTNWNGTFYIYPYARIINDSSTKFDYNNKLSIVNNVIYYKEQALNFTQSSRGVSNVYVGMEIDTHLIYMWIPLFPGWIAFALDTAQVHAAYTETWSIFKIVDRLAVSRLTPSAHVTTNDYEFTDQTPYAQVDTQENLMAQYFNLLSDNADAVLVSCNHWTYDNNGKPVPDYSSVTRSIVYLKDEKKFIIAATFSSRYDLKLYKWFQPVQQVYYYTIGGAPGNVEKEWTLDIIYPSAQSFDENDSMPINSRQLINFRTATTSLNGLMSAADKTDLTNFSTYFQKALVISSNTQAQGMFGAVYNITFITSTSINLSSTSIVIPAGSIGIYIPASTSTAAIIVVESTGSYPRVHRKVNGAWVS
jgi:hypothetical protein